jgi:hypothetical protein
VLVQDPGAGAGVPLGVSRGSLAVIHRGAGSILSVARVDQGAHVAAAAVVDGVVRNAAAFWGRSPRDERDRRGDTRPDAMTNIRQDSNDVDTTAAATCCRDSTRRSPPMAPIPLTRQPTRSRLTTTSTAGAWKRPLRLATCCQCARAIISSTSAAASVGPARYMGGSAAG